MRTVVKTIVIAALLSCGFASQALADTSAAPRTPGGWAITPAGRVITVPAWEPGLPGPWGVALSPDGRRALVTSSGAAVQYETTELFDLASGTRTSMQSYDGLNGESVFYGLVFSPDGRRAWASGAGQGVVHAYKVTAAGQLVTDRDIAAGFFPAGMAYGHTPLGDRLYVANNLGGPADPDNTYEDPPGHTVTVIDPTTGEVTATIDLGEPLDPFAVAFSRDGKKAFVTNWVGRSVSVIDARREEKKADILLSPHDAPFVADHPTGIAANPCRDEIYAANANSDTVSVIDARRDRLIATIDVALVRGGPKGSMPVGLTVSPDGRTLYVAEAGENAIAVVDLKQRRTVGFIPTAWYPADVKITRDGRRLVLVNTYGFGSGANPWGPYVPLSLYPDPAPPPPYYYYPGDYYAPPISETQYIGSMVKGSLEVIDLPCNHGAYTSQLRHWTKQVLRNNNAAARRWHKPKVLKAITHVIYVIKENRTFDQVLGDLGRGNGDSSLTLFTEASAPNHHELARRFVTLDNFYVDAEVSQDGHPWSTQGIATDYTEKVWPFDYAWAYSRSYDSEFVPLSEQFATEPLASDPSVPRPAAAATAGYLWDNAYDHGVSFRNYGESTAVDDEGKTYSDLTRLQARFGEHVDPDYPGWDLSISDHLVREPEWEREFADYVRNGDLPKLEIVYLPQDHTEGMAAGSATPESFVADNDLALGRLVDTLSHSKYWRSTAVFVVEDDAQDGPDHVDAHRTIAYVISPYTQHGTVDSTRYDTVSMLGTIERLLGLPPMSIYDRRATPMWASFAGSPDKRPYDALQPSVVPFGDPGYPVNTSDSELARLSAAQDFSQPDGPNEDILNRAIWQSVRGTTAYPVIR